MATISRRHAPPFEVVKDLDKNAIIPGKDTANQGKDTPLSRLSPLIEKESSPDDKISSPDIKIDDIGSQKKDGSKESATRKKSEDSEACQDFVIKNDVGHIKLTEIINHSIKKSVLNIVKEGVCPLAGSSDCRSKEPIKKPRSSWVQECQEKENKSESPKNLSSLLSAKANKTFNSRLCWTECQPSNSLYTPYKTFDHERININQCTREIRSHVTKENLSKEHVTKHTIKEQRIKSPKQQKKYIREITPKISRRVKGETNVSVYVTFIMLIFSR